MWQGSVHAPPAHGWEESSHTGGPEPAALKVAGLPAVGASTGMIQITVHSESPSVMLGAKKKLVFRHLGRGRGSAEQLPFLSVDPMDAPYLEQGDFSLK